jgi:hypothetical protein
MRIHYTVKATEGLSLSGSHDIWKLGHASPVACRHGGRDPCGHEQGSLTLMIYRCRRIFYADMCRICSEAADQNNNT